MKKALVIMGCVVTIASYAPIKAYDIFDEWFDDLRTLKENTTAKLRNITAQLGEAGTGFLNPAACDKGDHYLIEITLPGFKKEEVKIEYKDHTSSVNPNCFIISAEKADKTQTKDEKSSQYRAKSKNVKQIIYVPGVDDTKIDASLADGILTIKAPKKKEDKSATRSITIK